MASVKLSLKKEDLEEKTPIAVTANDKKIMLVMIGGNIYAIDATCSHRGGPLEKGTLSDFNIECPWHGALYDVRTGAGDQRTSWGPKQASYMVVEKNGDLFIEM